MAKPQEHHWGLLKMIGRHLISAPRNLEIRVANATLYYHGVCDSNKAGDQTSWKSTHGGVARHVRMPSSSGLPRD